MGRYLTKRMFQVLTPILLLPLLISSSFGASVNSSENGVWISEGRQFPLYGSKGKLLKSANLELKDLNLCSKVFCGKTCCSASHMQSASLAVENMAIYGEAYCLECSICHPNNVGIHSETPRVCASFCDRVFEACSVAYLSSNVFSDNSDNAFEQVIVPRGADKGVISGKASKWESNDTMGFTVQEADDSEEEPCFASNASLEAVMESGSSEEKTESFEWFRDLPDMIYEAELFEINMWINKIVAKGIVHLFRWLTQQEMLARIRRAVRRD